MRRLQLFERRFGRRPEIAGRGVGGEKSFVDEELLDLSHIVAADAEMERAREYEAASDPGGRSHAVLVIRCRVLEVRELRLQLSHAQKKRIDLCLEIGHGLRRDKRGRDDKENTERDYFYLFESEHHNEYKIKMTPVEGQ